MTLSTFYSVQQYQQIAVCNSLSSESRRHLSRLAGMLYWSKTALNTQHVRPCVPCSRTSEITVSVQHWTYYCHRLRPGHCALGGDWCSLFNSLLNIVWFQSTPVSPNCSDNCSTANGHANLVKSCVLIGQHKLILLSDWLKLTKWSSLMVAGDHIPCLFLVT